MVRRAEVQSRRRRSDAEIFSLFLRPLWNVEGDPTSTEMISGLTSFFGVDDMFSSFERGAGPLQP